MMTNIDWAKRVVPRMQREHPGWMPRKEWGSGPWEDEPDLVEWRHAGLACLAVRGGSGAWCGYVGVPGSHWAFGRRYDRVPESSSHGGLTFSNTCSGAICHEPAGDEPETVWWLGFDCAHAGDLAPSLDAIRSRYRMDLEALGSWLPRDVYRSLDYVKATVEALADELQTRKRWPALLEDYVAACKLFFRRDVPEMFKAIYLEWDWMGRGPCEREAIQLAYGGHEMRSDGLELVTKARAQDRPWRRA